MKENREVNSYRIRVRIGDRELEVEGDKDFVTETCLNLHARLLEITDLPAIKGSSIIFDEHNEATVTSNGYTPEKDEEPNQEARPSTVPLATYLRKTGASTESDKVLVIAAHLYEHRDVSEFNKDDIEQGYREALLKKSTNVSRDINYNRKKGYIDVAGEKEGLMSFYITREGLTAVSEMMA